MECLKVDRIAEDGLELSCRRSSLSVISGGLVKLQVLRDFVEDSTGHDKRLSIRAET
jgi:hypothetical protein